MSNVAASRSSSCGGRDSTHSRSPVARSETGPVARCTASARVAGRVMPRAWVGPPATTSCTWRRASGWAAGSVTSTTSTRTVSHRPSAMACATRSLLPYIDS
ncbi:Uncharacterised protein [Mycobacteroides abscessus]|nr:Uncharacterised protein [Mycobacteroides abscessus]